VNLLFKDMVGSIYRLCQYEAGSGSLPMAGFEINDVQLVMTVLLLNSFLFLRAV
jgi:hypothetical protein